MRPSPWVEHTVAVILCRAQGPTASSVQAKEVSTRNRTHEASEAPSTGRALSMIQEVQTSPAQAIKRLLPAPEGACLSIYLKRWGARESRERAAQSFLVQSQRSGRPQTRPCFFLHTPRVPFSRPPCHLLWLANAHSQGLCLQRK